MAPDVWQAWAFSRGRFSTAPEPAAMPTGPLAAGIAPLKPRWPPVASRGFVTPIGAARTRLAKTPRLPFACWGQTARLTNDGVAEHGRVLPADCERRERQRKTKNDESSRSFSA